MELPEDSLVEPNSVQVGNSRLVHYILYSISFLLLLAGTYLVMRPFFGPLAWAIIIVLSTWSWNLKLQRALSERKGISAALMTLLLFLILIIVTVPISIELGSELAQAREFIAAKSDQALPPLAAKAATIPIVGRSASRIIADLGGQQRKILEFVTEHQNEVFSFATTAAVGVIQLLINLFICLFCAYFFYRYGSELGEQLVKAASSVGGSRFRTLLQTARLTIRATVYGTLATALAQGLLAGIGFFVAGAPVPVLLGVLTAIFALIPVGPPIIYVPVILSMYVTQGWLPTTLLLVWCVVAVSCADNVIRPYFISKVTRTPLLLVFFGVVGGVISFGTLGVIIGPVIVAVIQSLWIEFVHPYELIATTEESLIERP